MTTDSKTKPADLATELLRLARRAAVTEDTLHWLIANVGAGGGARALHYKERLTKANDPPPFKVGDAVVQTESRKRGEVLSWSNISDDGRVRFDDGQEGIFPAALLERP